MTIDPQSLISGYLDDTLTSEQFAALQAWLKDRPEHADILAQAVLLHDRLRHELRVSDSVAVFPIPPAGDARNSRPRPFRSWITLAATLIALTLLIAAFLLPVANSPASAAVIELNRLIAVNARAADCTYRISVESQLLSRKRARQEAGREAGRPPKPPLDQAVLSVRGGRQFVLSRQTATGQAFVTGSNGRVSWAVRPDGPVRVSSDLTRFSRDLPGHEHDMPLISIDEDLERVRANYDIQFVPDSAPDAGATHATRTLVAVKRRKARGPERIEIIYVAATGRIRELRFCDMPYGPEHLTVRLTLTSEGDLGPRFFDHESHHGPERAVEFED